MIDMEEESTSTRTLIVLQELFHSFANCKKDIILSRRDNLEHLAIVMTTLVAPTKLPFKLESGEGVVLYSSQ